MDQELSEAFRDLTDKAILLKVDYPVKTPRQKSRLRNVIISFWKVYRDDEPRIFFTKDGYPQIMVKG